MRLDYILFFLSFTAAAQHSDIKPYAPELFPSHLSGAVIGFSNDGNIIYFVREDTTIQKLSIFQAERKGKKWENDQKLSFSGEYNDMGGRFSSDGNTIFFTSDRPGGSNNENDTWNIWKSRRIGNQWSTPEPLLDINSKGNECCPVPIDDDTFLYSGDRGKPMEWWIFQWSNEKETPIAQLTDEHAWQWPSYYDEKENVLFFNSMKRKDTRGMDDIYVSFFNNKAWSAPINIGYPVNTAIYEDGAILSYDKKYLIFNQHTTGSTPSRVMYTPWKPLLKNLNKAGFSSK